MLKLILIFLGILYVYGWAIQYPLLKQSRRMSTRIAAKDEFEVATLTRIKLRKKTMRFPLRYHWIWFRRLCKYTYLNLQHKIAPALIVALTVAPFAYALLWWNPQFRTAIYTVFFEQKCSDHVYASTADIETEMVETIQKMEDV